MKKLLSEEQVSELVSGADLGLSQEDIKKLYERMLALIEDGHKYMLIKSVEFKDGIVHERITNSISYPKYRVIKSENIKTKEVIYSLMSLENRLEVVRSTFSEPEQIKSEEMLNPEYKRRYEKYHLLGNKYTKHNMSNALSYLNYHSVGTIMDDEESKILYNEVSFYAVLREIILHHLNFH